jgi:hypothetical protein
MARDSATGRAGAYGIDVEVPAFAPGSVVLNPPMFMDDPARWLVLQVPSRGVAAPEIPFRVAEDLFAPRARPRLVNGRQENVCVLVYDGGAQYGAGASFELKAQMLDAGGAPVPFGKVALAKSVAETDGFRRFVLSFTPTSVPAGDYTFKVKFRAPNAEQPSEATQPVVVE